MRQALIACAIVGLLMCSSMSPAGAVWYDEDPAVKPGIPDTGWVSTDKRLTDSGGYCGYVAAVNALRYWDITWTKLIGDGVTDDALMTTLIDPVKKRYLYQTGTIAGTTCDEVENGLRNYITDQGYGTRIHQWNLYDITWDIMQREIRACEVVIVGIPTHWVTMVGWKSRASGMEQIGVHDPETDPAGVDWYDMRYVEVDAKKKLQMKYDGDWGDIGNIVAVTATPEVGSVFLVILGMPVVYLFRRRRDD